VRRVSCSLGAIAVAATLVFTGTVSAQPGNGATVSKEDECFTAAEQTICVDYHLVVHATATPSGNVHYVVNGDSTTTITGPGGYQRTHTEKLHTRFLVQDSATEHVNHYSSRVEISEGGITCNLRYLFHVVSGDVKVDLRLEECEPSSQ
jgi:hypothetical protein